MKLQEFTTEFIEDIRINAQIQNDTPANIFLYKIDISFSIIGQISTF